MSVICRAPSYDASTMITSPITSPAQVAWNPGPSFVSNPIPQSGASLTSPVGGGGLRSPSVGRGLSAFPSSSSMTLPAGGFRSPSVGRGFSPGLSRRFSGNRPADTSVPSVSFQTSTSYLSASDTLPTSRLLDPLPTSRLLDTLPTSRLLDPLPTSRPLQSALGAVTSASLQTSSYSLVGMKSSEPGRSNQDSHLEVDLSGGKVLVGVFDGHGQLGDQVSNRVKGVFAEMARTIVSAFDVRSAFQQAFSQAKNQIISIGSLAGTTATVALVDTVAQKVFIAHVGDSTAIVIGPRGNIVFQSQDHKPDSPCEMQRLSMCGTQVSGGYIHLNGRPGFSLGLARAIGDFVYSPQGVIAEPEFAQAISFEPGSTLVVASDGVWDVAKPKDKLVNMIMQSAPYDSSQRVVNAARATWAQHTPNGDIDDITAVVVKSTSADNGSSSLIGFSAPVTMTSPSLYNSGLYSAAPASYVI